jgi:hypothetical protein
LILRRLEISGMKKVHFRQIRDLKEWLDFKGVIQEWRHTVKTCFKKARTIGICTQILSK